MNRLSRIILWSLTGLLLPLQTAFSQDHQITPWRHNNLGAVSIGFDDGLPSQVTSAVPLLNARGLKATFFIVPGGIPDTPNGWDVTWDQWRAIAAQGHEIASHTVNHLDLTSLSDIDLRYELGESQRSINQHIPSQSCVALAYPMNLNNSHVQAVTSEYYISARGGWADEGGDLNFYEDPDPTWPLPPNVALGSYKAVNFYNVAGDNSPFAMPLSNLDDKLDFAIAHHAWYDMYLHDIPDGSYYTTYFATLLDHIVARNIWMASYGEVAQYMRERKASTLSVLSSDSSAIQLNLSNSLNATLYKEPLTIRSIVPSAWAKVSVTQGDSSKIVDSTVENASRVVYFDAKPNGGTIVLTQAGPLSGLSMSPATVQGGVLSTGTVTLDAPAPAGGAVISLTSSNTVAVQVPTSVTVLEGTTTATFTATTSPVASDATVTITALYNSISRTANLVVTVTAPVAALNAVSVSPATVQGGVSSTGMVTLDAPAPASGAVISLTSSNTSVVQVPESVTVLAEAATATFIATTSPVASDVTVTITAVYNGVSRATTLTVTRPAAALSGVSVSPTPVRGGVSSTGTVTLDAPAPASGAVVSLTSSNTAAVQVPASVTVPSGATTATFTATTSAVASDATVTITALYHSVSRTATLTVTAPAAALSGVSVSPTSVRGGVSSTGTVTLDAPAPASGALISLTSSNTAALQVPASVTVPSGATTATFVATTSPVASKTAPTITALYNGVSRTATLTVTVAALSAVSLSPATVLGGVSSTGTVTLDAPAPASGVVVSLTSSNTAAAQVPASVTVLAGARTASFTVTTNTVGSKTAVTITALYNSVTRRATLTVTAPTASALALSPTTVKGGNPSTGTVTLNSPAPSGGMVVTLTSSRTTAQVPASITVAAGGTTATFGITTTTVTSNQSVTISAKCGVTVKATLSVTP